MKTIFFAAAAVALLVSAPHASALPVTVTYQGVIDATQIVHGQTVAAPDYDVQDLFGGGNLEGDPFTAVINYNTSRGMGATTSDSAELSGGAAFYNQVTGVGYRSPILSESFTINGYTYGFSPDYYGDIFTEAGAGIEQEAFSTAGDSAILYFNSLSAPPRLRYSFSDDSESSYGAGYLLPAVASGQGDNLQFFISSADVSAAPEPSTWALLMSGVGLCGLALRRRLRLQPIQAAA